MWTRHLKFLQLVSKFRIVVFLKFCREHFMRNVSWSNVLVPLSGITQSTCQPE